MAADEAEWPDLGDPAVIELAFRRFADLAVERMAAAREEIDALNVYPVPDGDTGTNMYLTVESARDEMRANGVDLRTSLTSYARGALLGARGNSGVILSQLFGALVRHLAVARDRHAPATILARALEAAADAAYAAVGRPVEGTILTVARAAAVAADQAASDGRDVPTVVVAATEAAREALERTPDLLPLLRDAGVVDAGGRGLCVVFGAAEELLTGVRHITRVPEMGKRAIPVPVPTNDLTAGGPAYEVMYLLDADDEAIPALRSQLSGLGDSLVVVGGEGLWNVHVHVDDVGAAIESGIEAGRPRRIRVTHFAEQVERASARRRRRHGRKVVAVAAGPGLASLFEQAGAVVLRGGPGQRPSTGTVLEAIMTTGAEEVIVLPNDGDSVRVCEAAAQAAIDQDIRAVVVPTRAQVQGIAAIACHEPGRALESDVVAMTSAARHARHGAVTVAAKQAMTSAGRCEPGDALGVLEGDFVRVGDDLGEVAREIVTLMLGSGGELVTIVSGVEGEQLAQDLASYVESNWDGLDVIIYEGGQERYPLLISVE